MTTSLRLSAMFAWVILLAACDMGTVAPFAGPPTGVPPPASGKRLDIQPIFQQTPVWCWAATSEICIKYVRSGLGPNQYDILSAYTGLNCYDPFILSNFCVVAAPSMFTIQQALFFTGGVTSTLESRPLSYDEVRSEILADRPLIAGYQGSGGHVVVIHGYDDADQSLYIHDPIFGSFKVPYADSFTYVSGGGPLFWVQTIRGIASQ